MFWNKEKKEQIGGLQAVLQSENRMFHNALICLERLEAFLIKERHAESKLLPQTAVGSQEDRHDDSKNIPSRETYFMELSMNCNTLCIGAQYNEKDVFNAAAELFIKDLLEWYAGRDLLDYYDEVDACIIPLLTALTFQPSEVQNRFEEYVYTIPEIKLGYDDVKGGVEKWILGQHYQKEDAQRISENPNEGIIKNHSRGNALDGYKRIMRAMSIMYETSAPAKMVYKMIKEYLPYITSQFPNINEETLEKHITKGCSTPEEINVEEILEELSNTELLLNTSDEEVAIDEVTITTTYKRFYCPNPCGDESSKPMFWKHRDNDCYGDIYIGENGCFYCKKCGEQLSILYEAVFFSDGTIGNKRELAKQISEGIAKNGDITDLDWLNRLTSSFVKSIEK